MTDSITLVLNGVPVTLPPETSPTTTLLDWLRGPAALTGTKEGCAEGDCGACTVVVEQPDGRRLPINACLAMLGQLHGSVIRTVEGLRGADGAPHPIQQQMAEGDATQCGFCTPGIVMSAWAHAREGGAVHEALAGNLCRCTGYRPIIESLSKLTDDGAAPATAPAVVSATFEAPGQSFHRPTSLRELLAQRAAHPQAMLLAGGTDLGLLVSEHRQRPPHVIALQGVPELNALSADATGITLGAAVPYARLLPLLDGGLAPFATMLTRLGSRQIRGIGSLGGNLGTASPIGDTQPALLALGATVTLASLNGVRALPIAEFLLGYRKTAMAADEVILSIHIPRPPAGAVLAVEKISKRHDQDISAVSGGFLVEMANGRISRAVLAFGGMGPTAARAPHAEALLTGALLAPASFEAAAEELAHDFTPLSDWRGTAAYRLAAAEGLLRRFYWRIARPELAAEVHAL